MTETTTRTPPVQGASAGSLPAVLLVDDQPARLLTYESILSGLNVHCVRATSGEKALEHLLEREFAVVLLDVNMPGMDGFEVARLVREHPRMERTPIIFITGMHVSELDQLKGYEVGAIDYMTVPVVPEILRSKVAVLVELYQRRSELKTLNHALAEARTRGPGRVQVHEALYRSEERFRSIVRETGIGMVLIERDCTIRMVNPAFCAIVGRSEEELLGTNCLAITHPDDVDRNFRVVGRLLDGPQGSAQFEERYLRPDGSVRWVRLNIVRHVGEEADSSERLLAAVEDFTERIESRRALEESHREKQILLEAERAARGEAESAIRAKDDFLATLSHELRTPLSNVVSWARVLQRKYASEHADLARGLNIIVDNAMTQSQLISDLLDMSRIVAGKISLEATALDIAELVERAVNAQRPTAESRGLSLVVEPGIDVAFVLGDETRLQQVLWNLLSNAIKFTPAHSASPIRVCILRSGERYDVSITDPGEGIDARVLPYIFSRFRQGDSSKARRHGGLGLGLAIVKQLIEIHGGEVSARSPGVGQGATFTISLPVYEVDVRRPLTTPREDLDLLETQPLSGRTILVVEDQPPILEHLEHALEEHGAEAICVSTAHEALAILREQSRPIEILLSDIGLPEMDGYQLIRAIREELALTPEVLPAIAVSAFARDEDRTRSILHGFQAHVTKPYLVAQLVKTVASLLAKRE